ncbi:MAG TPA: putative baseplate assembly protein [Candidatus Dormibacteraeota bacterium]
MTLPVPDLDDRRFQDLVDDAKRLVQQRCPEWTDHNVSDPGVTLIETFAWMTDQLVYRLNRVPDRLYVKFLELIGVHLLPPTAARAPVTFWLSAPPEAVMTVPAETRVSTVRTDVDDAVVFSTADDLAIVACAARRVAVAAAGEERHRDMTDALDRGTGFTCFSSVPQPGDALIIGLDEAVPRCAIRLRLRCTIEGIGVDPTDPPLAWEAWDGEAWGSCEVDSDGTGGINRDGDVVLHVPAGHAIAIIGAERGGWLRARVTEAEEGQRAYTASPVIHGVEAVTLGGTVEAVHADTRTHETLGISEGVAGQRFGLAHRPLLGGADAAVLESGSDQGWQEWRAVDDFAASGPRDRHFVLDAVMGEVSLGPVVREADGLLHHHGAVPEKGVPLRLRSYRTGGGRLGNVSRGAVTVLKSSLPYIARVENRVPAQGGVDAEDIENAKRRGPMMLRTRNRAVTAEDFEELTREAAPELARARCVPAGEGVDAGSVRVLVIPTVADDRGRLRFERLIPGQATLEAIVRRLDECRLVGTRVIVEPPLYRGVTVVARLRARPRANLGRLEMAALDAVYAYLNPIGGGPEGRGWPFGRPVQMGEIFAVLQAVPGVDMIGDVRLFGADPITGHRGPATQVLDVEPHATVFSFEHQVLVEAP